MPKGFSQHQCKTVECQCYECSACKKRLVERSKFKKHQNTSDCRHVLSVEQKASDLNRENRRPVQPEGGGGSDGTAGAPGAGPGDVLQQPPVHPPSKLNWMFESLNG